MSPPKPRLPRARFPALGLALCLLFAPSEGGARSGFAVFPPDPEGLPAVRYARLDSEQCLAELRSRHIPYADAAARATIETPVTLTGRLRDVRFTSANGLDGVAHPQVLDCRLLLALDDLAGFLGERRIAEVRYNSIYRKGWVRAKGQRHPAGVAMDITEFVKDDGVVLNVRKDFDGDGVGSATCGERAKPSKAKKASELRELVCALDRAHVFNVILTPHYDYHHRDHFHIEVRRGILWFLTQ